MLREIASRARDFTELGCTEFDQPFRICFRLTDRSGSLIDSMPESASTLRNSVVYNGVERLAFALPEKPRKVSCENRFYRSRERLRIKFSSRQRSRRGRKQ